LTWVNRLSLRSQPSYKKSEIEADLGLVFDLFPRLKERFTQGGWKSSLRYSTTMKMVGVS